MLEPSEFKAVHTEAMRAAKSAANAYFVQKLGGRDQYACGFAWVVSSVKLSTKLGKEMAKCGFSKAYGGGISIWNPSGHICQNVDAKEAGARAYADVLKKHGIDSYAMSRLD